MSQSKRHSRWRLILFMAIFKWCTYALASNVIDSSYGLESFHWDHSIDLNEDYRVLWTLSNQDITFEIQVRALGYVGFGFSSNGRHAGADMAIAWVDRKQTFFQDRYVASDHVPEPLVDPSQDYVLIFGYENVTHTVIRFRRKLQTCDDDHDVAITNNTIRVMFMYSDKDPNQGSVLPGSLPNVLESWRPARSLVLTQHPNVHDQIAQSQKVRNRILELRNKNVNLPYPDDSLVWCKVFTVNNVEKKHHITRYEPIFDSSWSVHYLQQIILYECNGDSFELENMARMSGSICAGGRSLSLECNAIVASWSRGSEGFSFPKETGYPIDSHHAKFYLMETMYHNPNIDIDHLQFKQLFDNSGIRLHFTDDLRQHDAGILSIGVEPNWRQIIPPGQQRIVSEGQCIEDCTAYAFPSQGINIFAVMMRTHQIGREIKLRQIRKTEELPPIAYDSNIDSEYQDFRRLSHSVRALPGDRLVAQCIYDSSTRNAITLGGHTMKEESCTIFTLYYPRQRKLTTCHSLPSLPTVLQSLGIEVLATNINPIVIASPANLAGMTLETRLLSYDWKNFFNEFQRETLRGSFKPICLGANNENLPTSDRLIGRNVKLTKKYKMPRQCKPNRLFKSERTMSQIEFPAFYDIRVNNIHEGSVRSSRSSIIKTLPLSSTLSKSCKTPFLSRSILLLLLLLVLC